MDYSELILLFLATGATSLSGVGIACIPPGNPPCNFSFSMSLPMVKYSCGSTAPLGWCSKNVIRTSRAWRASSWEGGILDEVTGEGPVLRLGIGGGAMLEGDVV